MKKSLITSGLLALTMLSASSAFAEANCQAHPKNEQIPQADFQKALENMAPVVCGFSYRCMLPHFTHRR